MNAENRYIEVNKALWNAKTRHHIDSDFYDMKGFMDGNTSLKEVELGLLGDVKRKSIAHLQCHFGQDSISLARMGAKVVGLDLSDEAVTYANELAEKLRADASFVCDDVYNADKALNEQFDIVFTTYGVLGWLPDMKRWANVVAALLKPGGRLILAEMHPAVWMFDNQFTHIQYPYFNFGPIVETLKGTYADKEAEIEMEEIGWNHALSEVMQSLLDAGLRITHFGEYDTVPYPCFANTIEVAPGKFQIKGMEGKLPLVYSVVAVKD